MRNRLAKIMATVGPASAAPANLELLSDVGVDVFRLNFSHGAHEGHGKVVDAIREIEVRRKRSIAIVADMQGPKIRVATFSGDGMEMRYGETVTIKIGDNEGGDGVIYMPHPELLKALKPDCVLKFDDGKLSVRVTSVGKDIKAKVEVPGMIKNRKGVNVIGAVLPVSAMTEKDREDMIFALSKEVDYIALSFVQTVEDVTNAKAVIKGRAGLIVKIEKPSAVDDIEDIVREADGVMVARGDLGVELPLEQVPVVQRRIIQVARQMGRPVIVATHMLESMIDSPTPTRAEASDVATAMYQGADAVMLSAETAVGRHPATAVAIMDRIICAAEADPNYWDGFTGSKITRDDTAEDAISASVHTIAATLGAKAVFGYTSSGSTVKRISRTRPPCKIFGLTPHKTVASQMALCWGVTPVIMEDPVNFDDMLSDINMIAKKDLGFETGDTVLVSAGIPFGQPGTTNTLKIGVIE